MTQRPSVLHVTPRLARGGAGQALVQQIAAVDGFEHRVLSLTQPLEMADAVTQAKPDELGTADIVHLHFWNTPDFYELLARGLPPARVLLWGHVSGEHTPQVLTRELLEFADIAVAGTPRTGELPAAAGIDVRLIPPFPGWDHLEGLEPVPHDDFTVGYAGTVDPVKMHPRYVEMSARVRSPDVRFVVCGAGDGFSELARQADALDARDRFDLRGWVPDLGTMLAELDVFGYPLCEGNYSSAELILQEAMYAGVPPVVLPHGGAARTVEHGRTGIVARDEEDYARAIEYLHDHPDERRRLGRAAREHALATWSPEVVSRDWDSAYAELLTQPKRARAWKRDPGLVRAAEQAPGAALFTESLGDEAGPFRTSLLSDDPAALLAADREIALSPPVLVSAAGGGILHYRRNFPKDPYLRLWSGLVLREGGRPALAAGEFAGALAGGVGRERAEAWA